MGQTQISITAANPEIVIAILLSIEERILRKEVEPFCNQTDLKKKVANQSIAALDIGLVVRVKVATALAGYNWVGKGAGA